MAIDSKNYEKLLGKEEKKMNAVMMSIQSQRRSQSRACSQSSSWSIRRALKYDIK